MAQYHYIVAFDDTTNKWTCEDDASILDGNVWDNDKGWMWADNEEIPNSELIDQRCRNMLYALVSIWPAIDTTPYP